MKEPHDADENVFQTDADDKSVSNICFANLQDPANRKIVTYNFWQESQGCEHSTRNYLSVGVQLREHIGTQSSKNNIFYT